MTPWDGQDICRNTGGSLFQRGKVAMPMKQFETFSDDLTEGQSNVKAEEGWVERRGLIMNSRRSYNRCEDLSVLLASDMTLYFICSGILSQWSDLRSARQGCASGVPNLPSSTTYLTIQLFSAEISNVK